MNMDVVLQFFFIFMYISVVNYLISMGKSLKSIKWMDELSPYANFSVGYIKITHEKVR